MIPSVANVQIPLVPFFLNTSQVVPELACLLKIFSHLCENTNSVSVALKLGRTKCGVPPPTPAIRKLKGCSGEIPSGALFIEHLPPRALAG